MKFLSTQRPNLIIRFSFTFSCGCWVLTFVELWAIINFTILLWHYCDLGLLRVIGLLLCWAALFGSLILEGRGFRICYWSCLLTYLFCSSPFCGLSICSSSKEFRLVTYSLSIVDYEAHLGWHISFSHVFWKNDVSFYSTRVCTLSFLIRHTRICTFYFWNSFLFIE